VGIDQDQIRASVARRVKAFVGATSDSVAFVSHDSRGIAEAMSGRAYDLRFPSRT
jgi:hypothetical protein